jgi:hypothetical protein
LHAIHSRYDGYYAPVKEKSWSVKLFDGRIMNGRVLSGHCENCAGTSQVVAHNFGDADLVLFGCNNRRCKHTLIRMRIGPEEATAE